MGRMGEDGQKVRRPLYCGGLWSCTADSQQGATPPCPVALWAEEFVAYLLYSTFWGIFRGGAWNVFQLQTFPQLGSPGTTRPLSTLKVLWTRTDLVLEIR